MSAESATTSRFARLSSLDRMFLHLETPDWPGHFGGLAVAEGKALLDGAGQLRLQEIRERVHRRLAHVPQLRRRLHVPGPLGGKPLWVDDPPMGRYALPEEIGPSVVYLASDASSFMTGSVLVVDGGYTLW